MEQPSPVLVFQVLGHSDRTWSWRHETTHTQSYYPFGFDYRSWLDINSPLSPSSCPVLSRSTVSLLPYSSQDKWTRRRHRTPACTRTFGYDYIWEFLWILTEYTEDSCTWPQGCRLVLQVWLQVIQLVLSGMRYGHTCQVYVSLLASNSSFRVCAPICNSPEFTSGWSLSWFLARSLAFTGMSPPEDEMAFICLQEVAWLSVWFWTQRAEGPLWCNVFDISMTRGLNHWSPRFSSMFILVEGCIL